MLEKELIAKMVEYYRQTRERSKRYQFMAECWQKWKKIAFPMRTNSEKLAERILHRNAWDIRAITGRGPFALQWSIYELEDGGFALVVSE